MTRMLRPEEDRRTGEPTGQTLKTSVRFVPDSCDQQDQEERQLISSENLDKKNGVPETDGVATLIHFGLRN